MLLPFWLRATFALALAQAGLLLVLHARPGLAAVVLWYVTPPLVALAAIVLLGVAFVRSLRRREGLTACTLAGYLMLMGLVASLVAFRAYPSSHDVRPSDVPFRLPLDGPLTVAWGGPTLAVNYHVVLPDQRWAYDLLVTQNGRSFRTTGARVEDYYAYGRQVLSPASGVVLATRDTEPDEPIGHWRFRRATGNHVILQVAPGEFLFIAHLQPRSIAVAVGEHVRAGQLLGRVGNSGNTSEPHVHVHLQDTPTPYLGEGIPFYFYNYRVNNVEVPRGMPFGGRQRSRSRWPGAFTGKIIEHVD